MTPARVLLLERVALVAGALLMVGAIAAVDWRAGVFLAGLALAGSALEIPRRRP